MEQLVDPAVSLAKFERELASYRKQEGVYLSRGWWLLKTEFPTVFAVFGLPQLNPPGIAFGATIDFTNFDLWPPSVRLVNPFTRQPYKCRELPTPLPRLMPAGETRDPSTPPQALMQAYGPDDIPFLCLPGVREYHDHPAHSDDPWLLHRTRGEGTLLFIMEQLHQYGAQSIKGYAVRFQGIGVAFMVEGRE